jgi:CRP/FNR family transcriptional regulator, cyclic AMP receptor protein
MIVSTAGFDGSSMAISLGAAPRVQILRNATIRQRVENLDRRRRESFMKERFEGDEGRVLLIDTLKRQDVVEHNERLARALVADGELLEFAPATDIITQGAADNSVYFLLTGEANLYVNDRLVGSRGEGTSVGEMSAIDAAAPRSATVRAKTEVVAFRIQEAKFREVLDADPIAYRALAQLFAKRLRQRSHFYQPPNLHPVLFIGCSTEALSIANELQAGFKYDNIEAIVWTNGVFGPSGVAFDSLYHQVNRADFAAFVISPDDTVISRDTVQLAPRDNVLFELGLFMGALDRNRVFLIKEHSKDVSIPSDLLGITQTTYVFTGDNIAAAIGPVCTELRKAMTNLGVR